MFAVVRTGGKQYRVAPGDKIVVEKLDGNAGDKITLGEVLLAGEGAKLQSTSGLTVAAEIVAQAKADKVTVFKKRRRHNYRRKKGHRQQHTILKIVAIGDHKEEPKAKPAAKAAKPAADQPAPATDAAKSPTAKSPAAKAPAAKAPAAKAPAKAPAKAKAAGTTSQQKDGDVAGQPTPNPAPDDDKAAKGNEPAPDKAPAKKAAAKTPSTKNAAPAKGAPKKSPKAK
ncbi:MAG: 50S ribosomal protein L21 [Sphingomicrobium sp.]